MSTLANDGERQRRSTLDVPESRYLSEVLRDDLRLTGTKIGCNEAECGICTVLVNGTPVVSCVFPAFKAQGAVVETIEGLSQDGKLHPLQQAFPGSWRSAVRHLHARPDHDRQSAASSRKALRAKRVTEDDISVRHSKTPIAAARATRA